MRILLVLLSVILLFSCNSDLESQETDFIHVPSPDWSKQVIYFALTDRFNDGDPSNNDQGLGEFNPKSNDYYNGGDFQGIIDQLDYLQELGITTLWITPPVANQALAPNMNMAGYHGYWQSDPIDLDPHYGDLEAYKALSIALHKRGMYLVQDVVTNHMGNYFTYEGEFDPENQQNNFKIYPDQELNKAPWNLNDVRNKAHSEASIYNFTPDIQDYADQNQRLNYSLMALDDLNTKNPVVKEELRKAFGYWIKEVGVDGFRFDTPIYVEHDFWNDFMHSESEENPGMLPLARALGKKDFLNFGETWFTSMPMEDSGEKECKTYLGTKEKPEISSVLNFPLQATIKRVFAQSSPTSYMQYRMEATYNNFEDPRTSPTFIDNHDMARFMAGSNSKNLDQALLFLFTIPGIPIVYYGTEQHFTHSRSSMFAEGSNSEGKDHFNTQSSGFQYLQKLIEVRKSNPVFYKGTWTGCGDNSYGAGLLAYKMEYEEEQRFVIFNTASESLLATGINTGLPEGTILEPILGKGEPIKVGSIGFASLKMPPQFGEIYKVGAKKEAQIAVQLPEINSANIEQGRLLIKGQSITESISFSIDGILNNSASFKVTEGQFSESLSLGLTEAGLHSIIPFFDSGENIIVGIPFEFEVNYIPKSLAVVFDQAGDDNGPSGDYLYPTDPSFERQMDLSCIKVTALGNNLELEISTSLPMTTSWTPANGFDHVSFGIYIDFPNEEGAEVLPFRNANTPEDFAWDCYVDITGWTKNIYTSEGASASAWGNSTGPAPIVTKIDERTIKVKLSARALNWAKPLTGTKIYIATWDSEGEGGFRGLAAQPSGYTFGGAENGSKIMDDISVFELK